MKRICVYCGANSGAAPAYLAATQRFGRLLAEQGLGLVFGGGATGLMGALATAYVEASGRDLVGVIPERFGVKAAHSALTEVRETRTMHDRKQLMYELADGFIALPGGLGTLEEVMEMLTWAQLRHHQKPVGILDVNGYYRRLFELLDHMRDEGFCSAADRGRLIEDASPESLLERVLGHRLPAPEGPRPLAEAAAGAPPMEVADRGSAAPPRLERFNPLRPEFFADPYPIYARYRELEPVHWGVPQVPGRPGCWYLFRYADVQTVLRDARFVHRWPAGAPNRLIDAAPPSQRPFLEMADKWLLATDPPNHTRLRGLVSKAFSPAVVQGMRPRIQQIADTLLDRALDAGGFDVVAGYAFPLSMRVITGILGVRESDVDSVGPLAAAIADGINLRQDATAIERASRSTVALSAYFRELVAERRARPEDDLLSSLIAARDQGQALTEDELTSMCIQFIFAGYETTENHIAGGILALLRHPGELGRLQRSPDLIGRAAAELMRYDSPVQTAVRKASEDLVIGGRLIRAGESVVPVIGAANRDSEAFADPDRLDIQRVGPSAVFGSGIHACVGASLARVEGEIAIGTLVRRAPTLKLAVADVEWRPHVVLRGPRAVHVSV